MGGTDHKVFIATLGKSPTTKQGERGRGVDCVNKATYLEITNASPIGIELTMGWRGSVDLASLFVLAQLRLVQRFLRLLPALGSAPTRPSNSDRYLVADFKVAPPPGMSRQKWDLKRESWRKCGIRGAIMERLKETPHARAQSSLASCHRLIAAAKGGMQI